MCSTPPVRHARPARHVFAWAAAWREVQRDGPQFDSVDRHTGQGVRALRNGSLAVRWACSPTARRNGSRARGCRRTITTWTHRRSSTDSIITTRTYQDRLRTLQNVRDAGISVCSGGIIGMGEIHRRSLPDDRHARQTEPAPRVGADQLARRGGRHPARSPEACRLRRDGPDDRRRAHHDADRDGASLRRPDADERRGAAPVHDGRRELDLLRRQAAHHWQPGVRSRHGAAREGWRDAARKPDTAR